MLFLDCIYYIRYRIYLKNRVFFSSSRSIPDISILILVHCQLVVTQIIGVVRKILGKSELVFALTKRLSNERIESICYH